MRYRHPIKIEAPRERIWAVMCELESWPEWTASISSVRILSGLPLGVGSRVLVKQPRLLPNVFTVTEWEPGRSFTWETRSPGLRVVAGHVASDGGAILEIAFEGVLGRLLGWLGGGLTRSYVRMEAEGLKRRIEGDANVGFSP